MAGEVERGRQIQAQAVKEMSDAVTMRPDDASVLIPRGSVFLSAALQGGDDGTRTRGAHFLQRDSGGAYPWKLQLAVSCARYFSSRPRVFILKSDCNLRVGERVRVEGGMYEERKNWSASI